MPLRLLRSVRCPFPPLEERRNADHCPFFPAFPTIPTASAPARRSAAARSAGRLHLSRVRSRCHIDLDSNRRRNDRGVHRNACARILRRPDYIYSGGDLGHRLRSAEHADHHSDHRR